MRRAKSELTQAALNNSIVYNAPLKQGRGNNSFVGVENLGNETQKPKPKFELGLPKTYAQRCEGEPFPYEMIPLQKGLTQKDEDEFRSQFDYDFWPERKKTANDEPLCKEKFCPTKTTKGQVR